ncbi:hypothetical protein [Yinghuangia soli]|uniref:Uncharacterized protein n=1 Tax=Yinghuangia soli TaxID=2908204 RepID=A0AA41PZT6_9ACTN|nr:hypothetical protein [Yinghuangia soli]MCF2528858.1 hypothetical protein [Yinghuangia soli]
MSGLAKADISAIGKNAEGSLSARVVKALSDHGASPEGAARALGLKPTTPPQRRKLLFDLLTSDRERTARLALLAKVDSILRAEVPKRMRETPLEPAHFGLGTYEEVPKLLSDRLTRMETGAASLADFEAGLTGWLSNVAGSVYFERLVKYEPGLVAFVDALGADLVLLMNAGLTLGPQALRGVDGKPRIVSQAFGRPERVVRFSLEGSDGVVREFTDFGRLAPNPEGWWGLLPVEVKLERALGGVAGQFGDFLPRLAVARKLIAVVLDGRTEVERRIDPSDLVFLHHELGQTVITPVTRNLIARIEQHGPVTAGEVAKVTDFGPASSRVHQTSYYRARVLVARSWLDKLIAPIVGL